MAVDLWHSALKRSSVGHKRAALTDWIPFPHLILYYTLRLQISECLKGIWYHLPHLFELGQGAINCILGGNAQESGLNPQASHRIPNGKMAHKQKWTRTNGFSSLTLRQRGKCFHIPVWSCWEEAASSDSTWQHGSEIRVVWAWSHGKKTVSRNRTGWLGAACSTFFSDEKKMRFWGSMLAFPEGSSRIITCPIMWVVP